MLKRITAERVTGMNFLLTFQYLVSLSGATMKDIADALGYESSYISKWHSGKNLPAGRTFSETMDKLGYYFAARLDTEQAKAKLRCSYPHLESMIRSLPLADILPSILKDAYMLSVAEEKTRSEYNSVQVRPALQVVGSQEILHTCLGEIYHGIAVSQEDASIYLLADFLQFMDTNFLDAMRFHMTKKEKFVLKMMLYPKDSEEQRIAELEMYLLLLGQLPYMEVELYCGKATPSRQLVAMEGQFSGYCIDADDGVPNMLFLSREKNSIESAVIEAKRGMVPSRALYRANPKIENLFIQVNASFATKTQPILYVPFVLAYFGDDQLRQELYEEGKIDDVENEIWNNARHLLSSPAFKGIRLLVRQGTLVERIRNRELDLFDRKITVTKEQMRRYLTYPLGPLEASRNGSVSVIQDHLLDSTVQLPDLIIWAGEKESFLLRPQHVYHCSLESMYYPTGTEEMDDLLYKYLLKLLDHESTRHGAQKEIADFLMTFLEVAP